VSDEFPEPGEGNSPAAWTAVIIMLVAFTIGTIAFFFDLPVVVWASAVLLVVGLIVGFVLARMGYGVNGPKYVAKDH
jgi:membrane protein YdbS with pleckstrin-like domain